MKLSESECDLNHCHFFYTTLLTFCLKDDSILDRVTLEATRVGDVSIV